MLYLAGGEFPDGSASREMWRYDPCFDAWSEMAPMNVARSELGKGYQIPFNFKKWVSNESRVQDQKNYLANVSRFE